MLLFMLVVVVAAAVSDSSTLEQTSCSTTSVCFVKTRQDISHLENSIELLNRG